MESFESFYEGTPPWEIGRPQPIIQQVVDNGTVRGDVLDLGCGTGENAMYIAQRGHRVVGVDIVPAAIYKARAKARERVIDVEFVLGDAMDPSKLGRTFDTVIDSGFFHTLDDLERLCFVAGLERVVHPGGHYLMLCFSDRETRPGGPRRLTSGEIRLAFADGWEIVELRPARYESLIHEGGARAWFAVIRRADVVRGRNTRPPM